MMNIVHMSLPRQLEAAVLAEKIREALASRRIKLRPEGEMEVPLLSIRPSLAGALRKACLQKRVRFGFDDIAEKLAGEKRGIDHVNMQLHAMPKDRISRLLLFSNDGAERLYRHIEQILTEHSGRILGCRLDIDSKEMGQMLTVRSTGIKVILVEHKDAVSDILRSLVER